MDRRQGITPRGNSIQISFNYLGIRCRETLKLEPNKQNLKYASSLKATIQHEIAKGIFQYANHFPNSKNSSLRLKIDNKKINQALDEFMQASKRTCALSTWKNYHSAVEFHLKPNFGDIRLVDLTTQKVKSWIGGLDISNKRINNVLIPLRAIFKDAYQDGIIDRNPLDRISNLSVKQEEPNPLTPNEINAINDALPQQGKNFFMFAVWSGLRTSELIALEWGDIDWNKGYVRVRRAYVNKKIKQPKTKSGERDVLLLPPAFEALNNQKQFSYLKSERVFLNPRTNEPWETDGQIRKTMWIPALKKAGVTYRNPYQTRHTYASTLLSAGENPMFVAQQMGHKDWGMIRKRYGRFIQDVDSTAGSKVMAYWAQIGHKEAINV